MAELISGINDCANLFQLVSSWISYLRHQKLKEDDVLQLQSKLKCLDITLGAMYDLINRAEWRSHKANVAKQLPELKDAVYDAEDLLDEFKWYGLKVSARGNATVEQASVIEFFCSVIEGRFNKIVDIQERLDTVSSRLKEMDLDQGTPRFDKLVRVESSSFPAESNMIGREKEMTDVIEMLSRASSKRKEPGSGGAPPVLPIVGIGGVGKTTLAQHISEHKHVASRFKKNVIWICVSDDFDVKRLTKEALQSFPGTQTRGENLDSLQRDLEKSVKNKRLLLVLDDMWDDALRDNGLHWKTFCKPFRNALHGSTIMVTTRSQNVANQVGTMNSILLEGLKDDVFWDFFKSCAFGKDSAHSYPELESIGESILPKLRGSPLAAKTLGRVLGENLDTTHWNNILRSELWELPQQDTEILPALRLSYIYLPFHLKRCFSFCAVYPKDQKFEKESLAEIWVAEGFVEPQANIPVQDIGCSYFEDLVNRSMFQKSNSRSKYVIHDLMHDMAQLVLKDECFIIKKESDFDAVPKRVRHLSIYKNRDIKSSSLLDIRKHTRLRTLLCNKSLWNNTPVMEQWCSELRCLRVFSCVSTRELPESINNMKHLRYLDISGSDPFGSLPCPYNLQILHARRCKFDSLPSELNMLINLQKVESETLQYNRRPCKALTLMNYPGELVDSRDTFGRISLYGNSQGINLNERPEEWLGRNSDIFGRIFSSLMDLTIEGCENLSSLEHFVQPEYVPAIKKIKIINCQSLVSLPTARFGGFHYLEELEVSGCPKITSSSLLSGSLKKARLGTCGNVGDCIECFSLKYLEFSCSNSLASIKPDKWILPALKVLNIEFCYFLEFITESEQGSSSRLPFVSNFIRESEKVRNSRRPFSSLTDLIIYRCSKLLNISDLITHEYLPTIEILSVQRCDQLESLPGERFGSFPSLKNLTIEECPRLNWKTGTSLPSSLQRLSLKNCGDISTWFPKCLEHLPSLQELFLKSCCGIVSVPGSLWATKLASLKDLVIERCPDLVSIGGPNEIRNIHSVRIEDCGKLEGLNQPLKTGRYK